MYICVLYVKIVLKFKKYIKKSDLWLGEADLGIGMLFLDSSFPQRPQGQ
jgi:hypothetical protein